MVGVLAAVIVTALIVGPGEVAPTAATEWARSHQPVSAEEGVPTGATLASTRVDPWTERGEARVTLAFAGDIHFEDEIRSRLDRPQRALSTIDDALSTADVTIANLESAITRRGTPAPKLYHFRAPPKVLRAMAAGGIDVVTMANNHAVDYGAVGLRDTLRAAQRSPLPVVGVGRDAKRAFRPATLDVRGTSIAVLGATQVLDWTSATFAATDRSPGVASAVDADRLVRAVRRVDRNVDTVVVYLHFGQERLACPTSPQRAIVDRLRRAGADVVVGAHAHVLLGSGWRQQTFVAYGLGNFVWYSPNSAAEATTGVLTVRLRDGRPVGQAFQPAFIRQDGLPRPIEGAAGARARESFRALRGCSGLSVHR